MGQSQDVETALQNLQTIKSGGDPRSQTPSGASQTTDTAAKPETPDGDALSVAKAEVARLFEAHDLETDPETLDVAVARWDGKNGLAMYETELSKERYNKRVTKELTGVFASGHAIAINEQIFEEGNRDGFIDTVRHELAHIEEYERYGTRGHGANWKKMARMLGADPNRTHNKKETEYKYWLGCPECGWENGRLRKSKTIKNPSRYVCDTCDSHCISWADGKEKPTEPGNRNL